MDETLLTIPVRDDCPEGYFDIEIVSGYGVVKNSFRVEVFALGRVDHVQREAETPIQPVAHGRPHPLMAAMGIALILYCGWLFLHIDVLNTASFLVLIIGAVYTWYRQSQR